MNEEQKLRLDLLGACGYNIEAARKCLEFVKEEENKREQRKIDMPDGIYLIDEYEAIVSFDGKEKAGIGTITHIAIVQGNRSLAIALHDVSKEETSLTAKESEKDHGGYKDKYMDAVQDWDGKENTERLKQIRLNPAIQLKDGEYVPALAELYLMCLNQKAINAAMRFVGGQELTGWYWSSTECNETYAWVLYLGDGSTNLDNKATSTYKVRPVKKFL